jgi:hypothetical protein
MASEPKKPIEQMLEALAKARRAQFGDDPKMPNPMRARLHEEIARTGTSDEEKVGKSRASWITMFWPRLTVAAALATLIVLIPAIWWNQSHQVSGVANVALRERTAGARDALNSAASAEDTLANAPAVSAPEPTVNLADNRQINVEPAKPASEMEALKSSTRLAQGHGVTESPNQVTEGFDKKIATAKIQSAPAAAPAGGADLQAKSDRMAAAAPPVAQPSSAGNAAITQQFSQRSALQSFRNNAQVTQAANVLNTFQVQQQGDEIRVLDADGSTYTGKIEQSTKSAELDSRVARRDAAKQTRAYAAKPAGEKESTAPQSYFRATGYNVSLKKRLVFEGNYAAPAAQQPATATSNDRQQAESSRERARIVGTVRVNGEAPVEVDAIAETPEPAATKKSEK